MRRVRRGIAPPLANWMQTKRIGDAGSLLNNSLYPNFFCRPRVRAHQTCIGLIVLLGSGVHTVWTFWEIYSTSSWFEAEVAITVAAWYVATAIGSAIASMLVSKWSKRKLYVSGIATLCTLCYPMTYKMVTNSFLFTPPPFPSAHIRSCYRQFYCC